MTPGGNACASASHMAIVDSWNVGDAVKYKK